MTSIICCGVETRSMPAASQAASIDRAPLTMAPVCERAARAAAWLVPTVRSTTGLPAAEHDEAASRKRRPSRKSSQ